MGKTFLEGTQTDLDNKPFQSTDELMAYIEGEVPLHYKFMHGMSTEGITEETSSHLTSHEPEATRTIVCCCVQDTLAIMFPPRNAL